MATQRAFETLAGDNAHQYSKEDQIGVKKVIGRIAREGNVTLDNIDDIRMTDAYITAPPEVQMAIENMYADLDFAQDGQRRGAQFVKDVSAVRSSYGRSHRAVDEEIAKYVRAGYGDDVAKIRGLMKKRKDGTGYDWNDSEYERYLETHKKSTRTYTPKPEESVPWDDDVPDEEKKDDPSDVNVKEDVKETDPIQLLDRLDRKTKASINWGAKKGQMYDQTDKATAATKPVGKAEPSLEKAKPSKSLYDAFKKTKLYNWAYKKGVDDEGYHDGPMAQDVRRNFGDETAPDGKAIDRQSINGSFFSAIKYLGEKVDNLFEKKEKKEERSDIFGEKTEGKSVLSTIANNTGKAVDLLNEIAKKPAGVMLGIPGFDNIDMDGIKNRLYRDDDSAFGLASRLAGKAFTGARDKLNTAALWMEKMTKKSSRTFGNKDVDDLSSEDLFNIRSLQHAALMEGFEGDAARKLLDVYPVWRDLDITDEFIEAARQRQAAVKDPEKREILAHIAAMAVDLGKTFAGIGTMMFKRTIVGAGLAKDYIVKPGFAMGVKGLKGVLGFLENITGGARAGGWRDVRYTAEDLILIRDMIEDAKTDSPTSEVCRKVLEKFPQYKDIDTSDEAIEKARADVSAARSQSQEERSVLSYVGNILANVGSFTFKTAKDLIMDKLPRGFRSLNNLKNTVFDFASKIFNQVTDIYVAGRDSPVLRAKLMQAGEYIDSATGKVIQSMDDLAAIKGDIVDKAGNIVLTLKEAAQGIYDNKGQEIKSTVMKLATKVRDGVMGVGQAIRGFVAKGKDYSFGFGGKYIKESHDVLVDIRDIMLGDIEKVRERLNRRAEEKAAEDIASSSGTDNDTDGGSGSSSLSGGTAPSTTGVFGSAKRFLDSVLNPSQENRDRVNKLKDNVKGRFERNRDRLKGFLGGNSNEAVSDIKDAAEQKTANTGTVNWGAKKGQLFTPSSEPDKAMSVSQASGRTYQKVETPEDSISLRPTGKGTSPTGKLRRAKGLLGKGFGFLKNAATGAAGMLGGFLGGGQPDQQSQEDQNRENVDKPEHQRDDFSVVDGPDNRGTVAAKDRAWNDKDGNGGRDGGVADRQNKIDELKKARTKDQLKADLSLRYKGGNVIDKMLEIAKGFLGGIGTAIGGIVNLAGTAMSFLPGLGKIGAIAKGVLSSGLTKLPMLAAKGAWVAGKFAVGAAWTVSKAAVVLGAKAAMAAGSAILGAINVPVILGIAAVAGTAYGLYKLYQYANRDNANEYEQLRLRQYGFAGNSAVARYNHKAYMLEAYLEDGRVGYETGSKRAYLIKDKIKPEELLETFGIGEKDEERGKIFAQWFEKRFKPIFLAHCTAALKQDNKAKLADVHKFKPHQLVTYLEDTNINDDSVYDFDVSPIEGMDSFNCNVDEIKESFKNLIAKNRIAAEAAAKKAELPKKPEEPSAAKAFVKETDNIQNPKETDKAQAAAAATDNNKSVNASLTGGAKFGQVGEGDGTQAPPDNITQMKNLPTDRNGGGVSAGKVPMAVGQVLSGEAGMQFIKLGKNAVLDKMNPAMLKNFLGMAEEYGKLTGKSISVESAWRSAQEQQRLYNSLPKGRAAKPGSSLHEFGLALDISRNDAAELERLGLMKKYGFTRPIGQEPWHVEAAGIQKSIHEARSSPEAAAMLVDASLGRGGGGYGTVAGATKYKRNQQLAMSLLNAPGAPVEEDKATSSTSETLESVASATEKQNGPLPSVATTASGIQSASNDASYNGSKAQQVPLTGGPTASLEEAAQGDGKEPATPTSASGKAGEAPPPPKDKEEVKQVIEEASKKTGVDPDTVTTFAALESDLNPNARASTSSAKGLMQFIDPTWRGMLDKHGAKYGLDPKTPQTNAWAASLMGGEFIKENMKIISGVKPNPDVTDLYLGHFLGPSGAKKFLKSDPFATAAPEMPKAANANKSIFFDKGGRALTFGEIYEKVDNKVEKKAASYGISLDSSGTGLTGKAEGGTGFKSQGNVVQGPFAANGSTSPTKPESQSPTQQSGQSATSPLINIDSRSPASMASNAGQSGQVPAGMSMVGVESLLSQSLDVQKKSLDELVKIASHLSPEELVKAIASALKAMPQSESKGDTTPREKEEINMGRTVRASGSSLDLKRHRA
jgi:hypothetical protein